MMTRHGWQTKTLGELYEFRSGLSKEKSYFGKGYPFLSYKEIFNNYFVPLELPNLALASDEERKKFSIKRGDVFLTRTSETIEEVGMSCVALKDYPNATFNGFAKRLRPIDETIFPEYAVYYFRSKQFRDKASSVCYIITRASLNNDGLKRLTISFPSFIIQQKIANILIKYDLLILNNNKRIQLLEQIAEIIYDEWFVKFKFPGHENMKMVDSELGKIPDGWEIVNLNDIAEVLVGYPFKSKQFCDNSTLKPIVRIRDIPKNYTDTFSDEEVDEKYQIHDGDILIGMDGIFHTCKWSNGLAYLNQRVARLRPINDVSKYFLFLSTKPNIERLNNEIVGTTVQHLGQGDFQRMKILIPSPELMVLFKKMADVIYDNELKLRKKNTNLSITRDLLLPKLISGALDVSHLDIKTPEEKK